MDKIMRCLEDIFEYMSWDKEKLEENNISITYKKRIYDKKEVYRLISYDYTKMFNFLYDTFYILFRNEKVLQTPKSIEKDFEEEDLLEYIEESIKFYDYVDIELHIDKKEYYLKYSELKDTLNNFKFFPFIYSKNFVSWIEEFDYKKMEENLFEIDRQTIFLINDCNDSLYNNRVMIAGNNINIGIIKGFVVEFEHENDRETAKWRYEHVNWLNGAEWINPDCFYFDFTNIDIDIIVKNYFLKNTVNTIIPYLSNYVMYEDNIMLGIINGRKKITIKIKELDNYNQEQVRYLYEIYKWSYTGKNSDKLSILRNLITIFLCEDCGNNYYILLLKKSKDIYNTAIKNFDVYLKENVEQYFVARQRAMDLIESKSNEISNQISSTISNLNKTLFAFLGTIFTAIISFVENSNFTLIEFLLKSFIVYMVIYSCYYLSYSKIKVKQIKKYYDETILKMSSKLLGIDFSGNTNTKKYFERINENVTIFNIYWGATIFVNIVLAILAWLSLKRLNEIVEALNLK